jgi:hypothetical protein
MTETSSQSGSLMHGAAMLDRHRRTVVMFGCVYVAKRGRGIRMKWRGAVESACHVHQSR